ncbi:MAG: hypothetical protein SGILL_003338 [Bacillariaceae sp.]
MNLHPSQLEMNARLQARANFLAEMDQSAAFRGGASPPLLQQQRLLQQQEAMSRRPTFPKPCKNDVILGRGKPFQNWPGNQFMLSLCDCYRDRYHAAERAQKNHIIEEVKDIIKGQRHENFKMNCWVEVSERISYRKIGHAFRSNSRRLTAEKNAEIAAAEEAARTGKKYEEVLAESNMKTAASDSKKAAFEADDEEEPKLPPLPRDLPLSVTMSAATNTAPGASLPMPSAGLPMASAAMPPSADAMLQLEVRRRNLEERENRLLQMKMEMQAELEARNAMNTAGFGAPGSLYNARGMNPMAMGGGMGGMSGMGGLASAQAFGGGMMNPALLAQQRAVMASKLTPSFAALQGASGMGMGMSGAGFLGGQNSAAMPGMNMNSMTPAEMDLAMVRAGRLPPATLASGPLGGPTHGDGMLVDMLVKRSQNVKPPTSLAEINAMRRKSLSEEDQFRLGGMVPVEKKKKKLKKKRKHNKH